MKQRTIDVIVGVFVLAAAIALLVLAMKISGLTNTNKSTSYHIKADFDNVGSLKIGAPVSISGVKIGDVDSITLDPQTYRAVVLMEISSKESVLPTDTSASIFTEGILGSQYISLTPGFATKNLTEGGQIQNTHSALILENLIGQLIFNMKK
ncbi:MAG: outer membrane lipid asymmetry maintenance protein MlaD [Gammaproteobacteria bacterium]|nr:outer membrane lipid asymmetry maintenance protein MlaD [Gammaproteobacteria bacterium]